MTRPTCLKPMLSEREHQHPKPERQRWRLIHIRHSGLVYLREITPREGLLDLYVMYEHAGNAYIYQRVS